MSAAAACSIKPAIAARPKTVSVNGVEISRAAIARETQNHPAGTPIEAWKAAARALAIRALLLQEARRCNLIATPLVDDEGRSETDDEALLRAVIAGAILAPEPDEESCRRYFANNIRRFRTPDLCEVDHILIAAAPGDRDGRANARCLAEAIIAELQSAPERFAALAKAHSACPSAALGGNLGQIGPGQTVPEFERALAAMLAGVVHGSPIESRYGFHVVRVNRRSEGRQAPFEVVHPRIAAYLAEHVRRTAIRQYISLLAGCAVLVGVDLAASETPLVQ